MGVKKDQKTGKWIASHSQRPKGGGKPITLRRKCKTKAEAERVYKKLIVEIERRTRSKKIPTVAKVCEEFLETNKHTRWKISTWDNYRVMLNASAVRLWGNRYIDEVEEVEIRDYIALELASRSESHRKTVLKYIRGMFEFAVKKKYLTHNPTPDMRFRTVFRMDNVLNEMQTKTFLDKAKEMNVEWYPVWRFQVYVGTRSGEAIALRKANVDVKNRRILICETWNNKDGFKPYPKNHKHRWVEIAPSIIGMIEKLLVTDPESEFLLPRIDRWIRGDQARELRMFLSGIGLKQINFHDLRATWATMMLNKGIEPIKVMVMGGWKDMKTMQRYIRKAGIEIKGITDNFKID